METRSVAQSPYEEIRVTTQSAVAADLVCDAVWGGGNRPLEPGFKKREVLSETPQERWTYERIGHAMAWDRDYTMHVRRELLPEGGCRVTFETQNEKGPPPQHGAIRIPVIRGTWEISHLQEGGTRVIYTVYSEPGGRVPAFLARSGQRTSAVEWMKIILGRVDGDGPQHAKR
jgi:hypothetical protein